MHSVFVGRPVFWLLCQLCPAPASSHNQLAGTPVFSVTAWNGIVYGILRFRWS